MKLLEVRNFFLLRGYPMRSQAEQFVRFSRLSTIWTYLGAWRPYVLCRWYRTDVTITFGLNISAALIMKAVWLCKN